MTTFQNKLSADETALKFDPETIADLDPENDATGIKGGAGIPSKNAGGFQNC
jgi:hypothetical protein